jgi:hypothetical protein
LSAYPPALRGCLEPRQASPHILGHAAPGKIELTERLLRPGVAASGLHRQLLRRGGVPALRLGRIPGDAIAPLVQPGERQPGVVPAIASGDFIVLRGRRRIGLGSDASLQKLPDLHIG